MSVMIFIAPNLPLVDSIKAFMTFVFIMPMEILHHMEKGI